MFLEKMISLLGKSKTKQNPKTTEEILKEFKSQAYNNCFERGTPTRSALLRV